MEREGGIRAGYAVKGKRIPSRLQKEEDLKGKNCGVDPSS